MAVGKSAIGHQLAHQLGASFVDTDVVMVANHGSIAEIFAGRGEHAFRELEARAVARAVEDAQGGHGDLASAAAPCWTPERSSCWAAAPWSTSNATRTP